MQAQDPMVIEAKEAFKQHFGSTPSVGGTAPGRINLIGEHIDYCDGFVLPMAIAFKAVVVGSKNGLDKCRVFAKDKSAESTFQLEGGIVEKLPGDHPDYWCNYVRGVVAMMMKQGYEIEPFDMLCTGNVPLGSGLSSSAALEVATACFLEELMGFRIEGGKVTIATMCQSAEHEYAGVMCGIMDQFISAMGAEGNALMIDCRLQEGGKFDFELVRVTAPPTAPPSPLMRSHRALAPSHF